MSRVLTQLAAFAVVSLLAAPAAVWAQEPLPDLSLEDLMNLDTGRVFGASERLQAVTEAPASVSFITAEDIKRYGYRTLADVLRSVRGMYVTDDRNFSLVGIRGFSKPGDYNTRILLLINGHRVNDTVFGQAEIGAEFGMDATNFERVEIIRGPASSLYGDSAFFAVVNVITRTGAAINGISTAVEAGSLGAWYGRVTAGRRLSNGLDFAVSASGDRSDGVERLYFPAYDRPETNHGIAEGLDGERVGQLYGRFAFRNLTVVGAYGERQKDVPTASFRSLFNEQRFKEQTTDRHTMLDADYTVSTLLGRVSFRGSYDEFSYDGNYPMRPEDGVGVRRNSVLGSRWTVGARLNRALPGRQMLTLGADYIDNLHQDQALTFLNPMAAPVVDGDPSRAGYERPWSSTQRAVYAQDEIRPVRWLILNAGLRYDGYQDFSRVTPRTAVIVVPSAGESFKYLYGRAFRAPSQYELNRFFFGPNQQQHRLNPETIDTHELVWERYTNNWLRTAVSGYWYKADQLITSVSDPSAYLAETYVNQDQVRARGLELEGQMRLWRGIDATTSYALQKVTDQRTPDVQLANSPRHIAKLRLSIPAFTPQSFISVEAQHLSSRRTPDKNTVGSATTANLTLVQPLSANVDFVGTIRNLFDQKYADPVLHEQDSIAQNGRTVRVGLRWKLFTK